MLVKQPSSNTARRELGRGQIDLISTTQLGSSAPQIGMALIAAVGVLLLWLAPQLALNPIMVPLALLAVVFSIHAPFHVSLLLVVFSCFRVQEAYQLPSQLSPIFPLGMMIIISLFWHMSFTRSIKPSWSPELRTLASFVGVVTVGLLFAANRWLAYDEWASYLKIIIFTSAVAWFSRSFFHLKIFAYTIISCGMLISIVAIYNGFVGEGLVEGTRVSVGAADPKSFLANPNDLALLLLTPLSVTAAVLVQERSPVSRVVCTLIGSSIMWAIVLTQSRGALFGILASLAVIVFRRIKSKLTIVALLVGLAVLLYVAMGISGRVSGGAADEKGESAENRLIAWRAGINMAVSRPFGVGIGNFTSQFDQYSPARIPKITAHSIWFQVLGETGFVGLTMFTWLIVVCLRRALQNFRGLTACGAPPLITGLSLGVLAGIAGFCIAGSFLSLAYAWPLYLLVSLTSALAHCRSTCGLSANRAVVP